MKKISFYADEKILKAIEKLGAKANTGQFLRMAVHFYLENHEAIESIKKSLSTLEKMSIQPVITEQKKTQKTDDKASKRSRAINNLINMGSKE